MATFQRGAGILCHISSLPGKYGIGNFGRSAYDFADFLVKAKVRYWQILPLVQTGFGDSPYQSVCCSSGNPYFIDPETLHGEGLLTDSELKATECAGEAVDYSALFNHRYKALRIAYSRFDTKGDKFRAFVSSGKFDDYAMFMTLKEKLACSFENFPDEYKYRDKAALESFKRENIEEYNFWQFLQFEFEKQWLTLKKYVNSLGIKIIGDIPLYVAYDSSDVWAKPEQFLLDERLSPVAVAGVPPDYFCEDGQLWGNPLYDWERMAHDNYGWWVERVKQASELYDIIRIDHFRGLDRFYVIPADSKTAKVGEWRQGPAYALFEAIENALGEVPIIAEDLGVLDEGVYKLIERTGFPGMKVLQFAFDGSPENEHLPANITENSVTYTGTHDNDTTLGYLNKLDAEEFEFFKENLRQALESEGVDIEFSTRKKTAEACITCALATRSDIAIIPVQDLLLLGSEARMNTPSTCLGNWQFRLKEIPPESVAKNFAKQITKSSR